MNHRARHMLYCIVSYLAKGYQSRADNCPLGHFGLIWVQITVCIYFAICLCVWSNPVCLCVAITVCVWSSCSTVYCRLCPDRRPVLVGGLLPISFSISPLTSRENCPSTTTWKRSVLQTFSSNHCPTLDVLTLSIIWMPPPPLIFVYPFCRCNVVNGTQRRPWSNETCLERSHQSFLWPPTKQITRWLMFQQGWDELRSKVKSYYLIDR